MYRYDKGGDWRGDVDWVLTFGKDGKTPRDGGGEEHRGEDRLSFEILHQEEDGRIA